MMGKKVRVELDFGCHAVEELDKLREQTGLTSNVDVIKKALGLFQWAVRMNEQGWRILAKRNAEEHAVLLPHRG